jgi:hypothetical protein
MPAIRRHVLATLHERGDGLATTEIAEATDLSSIAARRALEDLTSHHVIERESQGQGKADLWHLAPWARRSYGLVSGFLEGDGDLTSTGVSEGAQTDLYRNVTDTNKPQDSILSNALPATTDISVTPPYGGSNTTPSSRQGSNGSAPEGWNQAEAEAALDEVIRNREPTS